MSKQIMSTAGLPIVLNYASIDDVESLIQLIAQKAKELNITSVVETIASAEGIEDLLSQDITTLLPLLQQIICELEGSSEFNDIVYRLLQVCTYNNVIITKQLFNDKPELREDYYKLKIEVVKFNLAPFLKSLSGLLASKATLEKNS